MPPNDDVTIGEQLEDLPADPKPPPDEGDAGLAEAEANDGS